MKTHETHETIACQLIEHVLVPHNGYHIGQKLHLLHSGHRIHGHVVRVEAHDANHDRLMVAVQDHEHEHEEPIHG